MTLTDSFPGPNGLTDSIEAGKDLAGLIAQNPDGTPRAGILAKGPGNLLTGRSDLRVDIAPFKAALVRNGAVRFIANDAGAQSPTFTVPTANSRIDIVYVKVNEVLQGDSSDGPVFGILQGAAAGIPLKPVLNIDGALELGTVRIASQDTGTAASPIDNSAPRTTAAGATNDHAEFTTVADGVPNGQPTGIGSVVVDSAQTDTAIITAHGGLQGVRLNAPGLYSLQYLASIGAAATGRSFLEIKRNGVGVARSSGMVGEDLLSVSIPNLLVKTAPVDITFEVLQTSGAARNVTGRIRATRIG